MILPTINRNIDKITPQILLGFSPDPLLFVYVCGLIITILQISYCLYTVDRNHSDVCRQQLRTVAGLH